ncbi:hypothetical protein R1flu_028998 [Riccia fluitans]|uniref:Glycoside hydrolase family 19 catalytic domain-containing protein n=1 Tax=Riccia fluitans TaxID=41844 RepID=A0ABD1XNC6_9MARC
MDSITTSVANKLRLKKPLMTTMLLLLLVMFTASVVDAACATSCSASMCCSSTGLCGPPKSVACGSNCISGPCTNEVTPYNVGLLGNYPLGRVVTLEMFDELFPARLRSFYSYEAFILAASAFPEFGTTGDVDMQKREVAAFLAHIQVETAGLSTIEARDTKDFCYLGVVEDISSACIAGKKYYPRGPMQLTWNYNYRRASDSIGEDLLAKPELVSENPAISFKTAFWVWMTPGLGLSKKPSSHAVMTQRSWSRSTAVESATGFGATINILKGETECGRASAQAEKRTAAYLRATEVLGVAPGHNLRC